MRQPDSVGCDIASLSLSLSKANIGPVVSQTQWDLVQGYLKEGVEEGARLVRTLVGRRFAGPWLSWVGGGAGWSKGRGVSAALAVGGGVCQRPQQSVRLGSAAA